MPAGCLHGSLEHDQTVDCCNGRVLWRCSRCLGTLRAAQAGPMLRPSRPQTLAARMRIYSRALLACLMARHTW